MTAKVRQAPEPDGRRPSSEVPKHTLESVLVVPQVIEDKNGGNPLPPMDVALGLGMSPGSSSFRDLLSSSIKYGLTAGSFNQPKVSLETLGKSIVAPTSTEERRISLFTAAVRPEPFRRVYEYYKGKKLPDAQFLGNTLVREFGISKENVGKFAEVFGANVEYLGLIKESPTGKWLSTDLSTQEPLSSNGAGSNNPAATLLSPVVLEAPGRSPLPPQIQTPYRP